MIEIEGHGDAFTVPAEVIAEGLMLDAADVPAMLAAGDIATSSEAGVDEDFGTFRLTFSTRNRRLRLIVDALGGIVAKSVLDFGSQPLPPGTRRPGAV